GQTVAKSNDTLSVRQFTPQSGVVMTSLDLGQLVNPVFANVTLQYNDTAWTTASARAFIGGLKEQLRIKVTQAREQFSATVGLVPLTPTTPVTNHTLLSAFGSLDLWYLPDGSGTLLAADSGDRFRVMVKSDRQLLALSETHKKHAFQFFPQPNRGTRGHPFCGKAGTVRLTGIPSEFNALLSIPCRYALPDGIELRGDYQLEPDARTWRIKTPKAEYLANRKRLSLVALDLSQMGPGKASGNPIFRTRQDFRQAMRSVPISARRLRADTRLIALKLRPGYTPTQVAWMDYWGRYSYQQRLLFGLPDKEHGVQQVIIGQTTVRKKSTTRNAWQPESTASVVYSPKHQRLYQVTLGSYQSLGSFGRVAVMAEGLLLSGTPGADRISLKAFRLNTYYHENRVVSRRQFGVMVEGQGGSDVI
ncbi:hypothetical protein, partial [Endozoicomonas sp. SESOKO4]|uniref:hypothetical protein n=1 Tax=Endozoicomonas sp. SESOKO4 TaxID=2828745 RepID=UPI0021494B3C